MSWECVEGVICGKCGEKGHLQRNCKQISCHKCGRKGHIAKFCNDPFAKAAEVERHERQQALASARTPVPSLSERSDGFGTRETGISVSVLHKDMRGPWDGLGVNRRDVGSVEKDQQTDKGASVHSQVAASSIDTKKRLAPSSVRSMVSRRLKIVGVKSDNEAQKPAPSTELLRPLETSGTSQWQGLVGYGSEDSADDHPSDDDRPGGTPG